MATNPTESVWSSMIAARQLSVTFYTLSTCLTDLLHRHNDLVASQAQTTASSSLLQSLDQTLFSSSTATNPSKLFDEYSNVLQSILKQNSLHANIIQNVRRLFRFESCLKELFSTELNEHCHCQECDCTISNSITDVVHDVGEIRPSLLTEASQTPCVCFRCGEQNQQKTITFKQSSPCLALTANRLNIAPSEQLTSAQGVVYELVYIIEFDSIARSIVNVYLRQGAEFVKVDGVDVSSRCSTIVGQGKFLTLWLSSSSAPQTDAPQPTTNTQTHTYLSPPQSASSTSQTTSNSQTTNETAIVDLTSSTTTLEDILMPTTSMVNAAAADDDDDQFWNSLNESQPAPVSENPSSSANDSVSDLYLTLLHSANKDSSSIKSHTDLNRTVNTLATDVLWPLIVDQSKRRSEKTSSSSTTTTVRSVSSNSSTNSSAHLRNRVGKQLSSTARSRRVHPYTTA